MAWALRVTYPTGDSEWLRDLKRQVRTFSERQAAVHTAKLVQQLLPTGTTVTVSQRRHPRLRTKA